MPYLLSNIFILSMEKLISRLISNKKSKLYLKDINLCKNLFLFVHI